MLYREKARVKSAAAAAVGGGRIVGKGWRRRRGAADTESRSHGNSRLFTCMCARG